MLSVRSILASLWLVALGVFCRPPQPAWAQKRGAQDAPKDALQYLGSYSAPSAISATATGHISAHPPSPPASRRLRRIEAGPTLLPPWPLDLAWTVEEVSAACSDPRVERKAQDVERALEKQTVATDEDSARGEVRCQRLAWNVALERAYARRPGAVDELTASLPDAPSPATGYLLLFLSRLAAGDATTAHDFFDKLTSPGAKADISPEARAETPTARRRRTSAIAMPERDYLWAKAIWNWASGRPGEARELLTRLASLEPEAASVWFVLGGVALEEARVNSRRLAESAPESSWNRRLESEAVELRYPNLARSILPQQATAEASGAGRTDDEKLQAASPDSRRDDHPELELRSLESLPESPEVLYRRARAAVRLSQLAYGRASRSPLFGAFFHAIRALAAEEEEDEPAAEREYRTGLAENADSALLHAGLGHLLRMRLQLELARDELARAAALDPTDSVAAFELGDVYQRLGDQARALPLLSHALEIDPTLLVARWSRARAYAALGDDLQALSDFEAAALADHSGELQWQLARLYRKIGREDLAQRAQERSEQQRAAAGPKDSGQSTPQ